MASDKEEPKSLEVETPESKVDQQAPADALSRTPDDLEEEAKKTKQETGTDDALTPEKQISPLKRFAKKVNVYLLLFLLLVIVAGAVAIVSYLNSQHTPTDPALSSQGLSEDTLKQLANTDATVGDASQTLTIQGSAVIAGQTLMRGNLNVAGNLQTGGSIRGPELTISGSSNLNDTQVTELQVEGDAAIQGSATLGSLDVSGNSSFGGAIKAPQLTVSRLILSGNASLEVPNHISFPGPTPIRSINSAVLGSGGSSSINGSDTSGTVNINTGNSPQAGCFVRVTFRQAFTNRPHVIISPVGNAAGRTQHYVDRDQNGFSICTSSPAPANQKFAFDYFVTN